MTIGDAHHFWKTYRKIEEILSTYFEKIDNREIYCFVVDSKSLNSPLAVNLWEEKYGFVLEREIPAAIWLKQEPEITAEEFILEYTFL